MEAEWVVGFFRSASKRIDAPVLGHYIRPTWAKHRVLRLHKVVKWIENATVSYEFDMGPSRKICTS